jgi:hypothetical protein
MLSIDAGFEESGAQKVPIIFQGVAKCLFTRV